MKKFLETSHFNSISTIIRRGLNKIYKVGNENKSLIFVISLTAKKKSKIYHRFSFKHFMSERDYYILSKYCYYKILVPL